MEPKAAPVAKITRPALTGCFPRKRLFRLLDDARKIPVLWVSAPAGSGKTTLISSYLERGKRSCLWYRLSEADNDIATFFYYMGQAAQRASPRARKPLPLLAPEFLPGLAVFAQRYFENLFDRLPSPFVMVFDDYQKVHADSPLHEVLRDGLSLLPEGRKAILISRSEPPPAFARLRASHRMSAIGWKELRLTPEETEGIARLRWKKKRDAGAVRYLQSRSDGWAAGLTLLLSKADTEGIEPQRLKEHTPAEIFDYFAGELFDKTDRASRDFLLATAFLPTVTKTMAERLTGQVSSGQILSNLDRHNYFLMKHARGEPVYEYHSLFREFLLSQAESLLPPAEMFRIRRAAAEILEESGHLEDAAALLRATSEWERLTGLIRRHAPALLLQGRYRTLEAWLGYLPGREIGENPWLTYWRGMCRLPSDPAESRGAFESAFRQFHGHRDVPGVFLAWSGIVESIIYGAEGLKPLDRWFSLLDGLMSEFGDFPSEEVGARVTCSMVRALALRRPHDSAMERWADRALELSRTGKDVSTRIEALIHLASYRYGGGELRELEVLLDSLREVIRRPDVSPLARLTVSWVEAAQANLASRSDRCIEVVREGLSLAESTGVHVMDFMLMGQGALCSLKSGDFATAKRYLGTMASSLPLAKPWEASFYHYAAAWDALLRGDPARAAHHSDQGLALCREVGNPWTLHLAHLQRSNLFHAAGDDGKAAVHLSEACDAGAQGRNEHARFSCLLTQACYYLHEGNESAALLSLREGMRIGREKGFVGLPMWLPGTMERVVAKSLEGGIEVPYARDLIRRNALLPDEASGLENWPWRLKVLTLGRFALIREDRPVPFSRKVQQRPLSLLKALIALGGKDVPEERLTDALWPEADGDLAHQSFATTLHRLRLLSGEEKALPLREGRLTLDGRHGWVDAWAFEELLRRAETARRTGTDRSSDAKAHRLTEQAIALYKGPFLAGEAAHSWIVSTRERLQGKFLKAVVEVGRRWEIAGEWEKAAACYHGGLDVDDLAEVFYRRLMVCLKRLGRDSEADAVYHRCRKTLAARLGRNPSSET
ncbi:MAG TPA: BTAD domain-containing putative transcriptional regulator, partial [Candidatus Methylomirabilis sp.]|nr:BTAD domain-containing putative transcriptional regulator [Candidatus Methylomirabilis sp.]